MNPVESSFLGTNARLEERRPRANVGMGTIAMRLAAFDDWVRDWQDEPGRWMAFDQFIRTQLREIAGAGRIRCYRLVQHGEELESLTPTKEPNADRISARDGIYGYVVSRGHRYIRDDALLGPTVHSLANRSSDPLSWCFPVRHEAGTFGLICVGSVRGDVAADIALQESLGGVISLLWGRLIDREETILARKIDQGSGVLSRSHFFKAAEQTLSDGYASHEPTMAMVLAVEGMRRLDDAGLWDVRDTAVVAAGRAIRNKLRSDDLVGRFCDDRFVVLMRRLDTALGRMIAEKLVDAVQELMNQACAGVAEVVVRCGLAGTGQQHPTLKQLLGQAFEAVNEGRRLGQNLYDDLCDDDEEPA